MAELSGLKRRLSGCFTNNLSKPVSKICNGFGCIIQVFICTVTGQRINIVEWIQNINSLYVHFTGQKSHNDRLDELLCKIVMTIICSAKCTAN